MPVVLDCREIGAVSIQVEYVKGWGKLTGKGEVEVALLDGGSSTISTKDVIIATGSEVSPLPGLIIDEERCGSTVSSTHACWTLWPIVIMLLSACPDCLAPAWTPTLTHIFP